MNVQTASEMIPQDELFKIILADLRRIVREYATATTESSCPAIRRTFAELTDSTLRMQGDLYMLLEQNRIYSAPAGASRQELNKHLQEAEKTHQKVHQIMQQHSARQSPNPSQNPSPYQHQSNVAYHPSNVDNPYYS
ncbi:spore coat protein [Paenibacillus sp. M1]|uniref:Spore coat protein n=1 Tax=Paenibacillus haidiansis TaxID=1574488 RepID=A0ABU7VUE2_9BACL